MTQTEQAPSPVLVLYFPPAPRAVDLTAMGDPARRAAAICSRANQVRQAVEGHRDAEAVALAEALARGLQGGSAARRDRPSFLHGVLLDRAARALEEAAEERDPAMLAEAREWLHALAASVAWSWSLRAGIAGPMSEEERSASHAVRGCRALLQALAVGAVGEAVLHAERVASQLALAQRWPEASALRGRASALEARLDRGDREEIAGAAAALEAAALRLLGTMDPGDLARPFSPHPSVGSPEAGRHAAMGLAALAGRDLVGLADEAMAAAAHLHAPACVEAGWGQSADDLLNRAQGLRACLERRDHASARHAAQRVEVALARIEALSPAASAVAGPLARPEPAAAAG